MLRKINDKNRNLYFSIINEQIEFDREKYKFFGKVKEFKSETKKNIGYVSFFQGKVYGYMSITVDIVDERVINFSLIAFEKNREFFIDFMNFVMTITEIYKSFELRIITKSPAIRLAEKFFKIYGFKKIGTLEKTRKIDNIYYDENIYFLNKR